FLGLDPGRNKAGWALVGRNGGLILSGLFPVSETEAFLEVWFCPAKDWERGLAAWTVERRFPVPGSGEGVECAVLGDGTGSREMAEVLRRMGFRTKLVDERGTTLAAQKLYWALHAPRWWQCCLPRFMRFPPRSVDDLAAWAVVLRSFGLSLEELRQKAARLKD
ncbi:MAG: hypothetical protein LBL51_01275, partial [Synergistaceae bacterium]|nr:hypothetical protein [Synergistaceae bacterium]